MTKKLKLKKRFTLKKYRGGGDITVTLPELPHVNYYTISDSYKEIIKKLEMNINLKNVNNEEELTIHRGELRLRDTETIKKSCFGYISEMPNDFRIRLINNEIRKQFTENINKIKLDYEALIQESNVKNDVDESQEIIFQIIVGCIEKLYETMVKFLSILSTKTFPIYTKYLKLKIERIEEQLSEVKAIELTDHKHIKLTRIKPLKIGNNIGLYELWKDKKDTIIDSGIEDEDIDSILKCKRWKGKLTLGKDDIYTFTYIHHNDEEECKKPVTKKSGFPSLT